MAQILNSLLLNSALKKVWKPTRPFRYDLDFHGGSDSKASVYNVGDLGSIPGSGRSPGGENGSILDPVFLPKKSHG